MHYVLILHSLRSKQTPSTSAYWLFEGFYYFHMSVLAFFVALCYYSIFVTFIAIVFTHRQQIRCDCARFFVSGIVSMSIHRPKILTTVKLIKSNVRTNNTHFIIILCDTHRVNGIEMKTELRKQRLYVEWLNVKSYSKIFRFTHECCEKFKRRRDDKEAKNLAVVCASKYRSN